MTRTQIEVVVGDIADVESHQAEAYVVAANNELWMGSGVAGALKRAAGDVVEQEAISQGPIEVGDAVMTSSGQMSPPTKALIHAAAMGFTDRTQIYASKETVSATTRRALELCDERGLTSVVLPALGTGVGGLEHEDCAEAMCATIESYLSSGTGLNRIRFVVTNDERAKVFQGQIDAHGLR